MILQLLQVSSQKQLPEKVLPLAPKVEPCIAPKAIGWSLQDLHTCSKRDEHLRIPTSMRKAYENERSDSGLAQMPKSLVGVFLHQSLTLLGCTDIWKKTWQYGQWSNYLSHERHCKLHGLHELRLWDDWLRCEHLHCRQLRWKRGIWQKDPKLIFC